MADKTRLLLTSLILYLVPVAKGGCIGLWPLWPFRDYNLCGKLVAPPTVATVSADCRRRAPKNASMSRCPSLVFFSSPAWLNPEQQILMKQVKRMCRLSSFRSGPSSSVWPARVAEYFLQPTWKNCPFHRRNWEGPRDKTGGQRVADATIVEHGNKRSGSRCSSKRPRGWARTPTGLNCYWLGMSVIVNVGR